MLSLAALKDRSEYKYSHFALSAARLNIIFLVLFFKKEQLSYLKVPPV